MSANTTIQEGGKGYPFGPVKCLMVEGDDGKFYPWYPEADRALDSLSVDKNGIYRASARGVYGWNRVSVNVAQSDRVTGKDPETGEEKTVTVDPDTGELVETVVPVEIRVTTLPTKTDYTDGETIDYSGIVVHAYSSTGEDMGAVPFSELVFPITTADKGEARTDEWSDGAGVTAMLISYTPKWDLNWQGEEVQKWISQQIGTKNGMPAMWGGDGPTQFFATIHNGDLYTFGSTADRSLNGYTYDASREYNKYSLFEGTSASSGSGEVVRHTGHQNWLTGIPSSSSVPTGTDDLQPVPATQSLPVQWQRPGDGAILETSFNINVTGGN